MVAIRDVKARQVLDSRGNPTVEVDIITKGGLSRAIVPSGASTGIYEALELRDNNSSFNGKSVSKAVKNINVKISNAIVGLDCTKQFEIDSLLLALDGTTNKSRLGANSILAVSMAVCRAGAMAKKISLYKYIARLAKTKNNHLSLPIPSFNVINGGVHAGNNLAFQEYMILPVGARNFFSALRMGVEVYHQLKKVIRSKYGLNSINVGDEGGFAPPLDKVEDPLKLLTSAVKKAGYEGDVKFGLDVAASEFYKGGKYFIDGKNISSDELSKIYVRLVKKYPIVSIEDPFNQEDFVSFANLRRKLSGVQIVGDDLLVTNVDRIRTALRFSSCNVLLLKINQVGSISESLAANKLARDSGWDVMVSNRSGETEDSFIADLVVGLGAGQIKSGAPCRSERTAKYNQLLRISEDIKKFASFKVK